MARRCPAQSRRHASRDKAPRASATTFLGLPSILHEPLETIRQREEDGYRQVKDWPFRRYDGAGGFEDTMLEGCTWLNEPSDWHLEAGVLRVTTDAETDFWRETHYGFTRDSGHFFGWVTQGDFTAELRVRARYEALYDQAGIMVRIDEAHWIKAGVEMSDGMVLLSSVLTAGKSDWAMGIYPDDPTDFRVRVTVAEGVLRLQISADGITWHLARLSPFPRAEAYSVGPMCCTPERSGLKVVFSDFQVRPPLDRALHETS